jgi:hypothetical protein
MPGIFPEFPEIILLKSFFPGFPGNSRFPDGKWTVSREISREFPVPGIPVPGTFPECPTLIASPNA